MNHEAFLSAILEYPDDDAPRLIYADWLEEHGEPARAEFIRAQCLRASGGSDLRRSPELLAREQELLSLHADEWLVPLQRLGQDWRFQRGFVVGGTITAQTLLEQADDLFRRVPLLNSVRLCQVSGALDSLLSVDHLGRLRRLELVEESLTDEDMWSFLSLPDGSRLKELDLSRNQITTVGVNHLAFALRSRHLTSLALADNAIDCDEYLFEEVAWRELQSLNLSGNRISFSSVKSLAQGNLSNLLALDLSRVDFGPWEGATSFDFKHMNKFEFRNGRFEDNGFIVREDEAGTPSYYQHEDCQSAAQFVVLTIVHSPWRQQLRRLSFSSNALGDAAGCFASHRREYHSVIDGDWWHPSFDTDWPNLELLELADETIPEQTRDDLQDVFGDRVTFARAEPVVGSQ